MCGSNVRPWGLRAPPLPLHPSHPTFPLNTHDGHSSHPFPHPSRAHHPHTPSTRGRQFGSYQGSSHLASPHPFDRGSGGYKTHLGSSLAFPRRAPTHARSFQHPYITALPPYPSLVPLAIPLRPPLPFSLPSPPSPDLPPSPPFPSSPFSAAQGQVRPAPPAPARPLRQGPPGPRPM